MKLSTAARNGLPKDEFAGPDRSYSVPNKSHAMNAKARATQMVGKGKLSAAMASRIRAKANKVLGAR